MRTSASRFSVPFLGGRVSSIASTPTKKTVSHSATTVITQGITIHNRPVDPVTCRTEPKQRFFLPELAGCHSGGWKSRPIMFSIAPKIWLARQATYKVTANGLALFGYRKERGNTASLLLKPKLLPRTSPMLWLSFPHSLTHTLFFPIYRTGNRSANVRLVRASCRHGRRGILG